MKTSIFISSIAALSLLITLAETPGHQSAEVKPASLTSNFYYVPSQTVSENKVIKVAAKSKEYAEVKIKNTEVEGLSYLSFDVADYTHDEETATTANDENSFDYLKFDVTDYAGNDNLSSPDAIDLPESEMNKLKFDANKYVENNDPTSFDVNEFPVVTFDYLKFDVNQYVIADKVNSSEITELPVDEYNYLKFDVNMYDSKDTLQADSFSKLPEMK